MDPEALLRAAFDAYMRRDVDDMMAFVTDDVEVLPALGAAVEGRAFVGREGITVFFGILDDMWTEFAFELGEVRVRGNRVVTLGRVRMRGAESGVEFDELSASVTDIRDGKIARWESFFGYDEALAMLEEAP